MKKFLCILGISAVLLTGCGEKNNSSDESLNAAVRDVFAMDTYMNLKAYGEAPDAALDEALSEINRLENLLSVTNENSDISRINRAGGESVPVDESTAEIIRKAVEISVETSGCLDVSIYPVLKEWGFTTSEYKIPDRNILDELLENVDYQQISLENDSVTVPPSFQLDLGALAKGYTSDSIMKIFRENGVDSAIVSLGGNVQTIGKKPDGSPWKVAVVDPFAPDQTMAVLAVSDKAVITSGNYERYFIGEDGQRYHHIIDPKTGCPAENGLVSVTIIGESGIECDALSTALFVAGKEDAVAYWRKHDGFDMILVTDDKRIFYTERLSGIFENVGNMNAEVIFSD